MLKKEKKKKKDKNWKVYDHERIIISQNLIVVQSGTYNPITY